MKLIVSQIEDILVKMQYEIREEISDRQINKMLNYWIFLDKNEKELQETLGMSLETLLYSKYYWCTQYKNKYSELYGKNVGIEQQQYKIIEEIAQRVNEVNWGGFE